MTEEKKKKKKGPRPTRTSRGGGGKKGARKAPQRAAVAAELESLERWLEAGQLQQATASFDRLRRLGAYAAATWGVQAASSDSLVVTTKLPEDLCASAHKCLGDFCHYAPSDANLQQAKERYRAAARFFTLVDRSRALRVVARLVRVHAFASASVSQLLKDRALIEWAMSVAPHASTNDSDELRLSLVETCGRIVRENPFDTREERVELLALVRPVHLSLLLDQPAPSRQRALPWAELASALQPAWRSSFDAAWDEESVRSLFEATRTSGVPQLAVAAARRAVELEDGSSYEVGLRAEERTEETARRRTQNTTDHLNVLARLQLFDGDREGAQASLRSAEETIASGNHAERIRIWAENTALFAPDEAGEWVAFTKLRLGALRELAADWEDPVLYPSLAARPLSSIRRRAIEVHADYVVETIERFAKTYPALSRRLARS